MSLNLGMPGKLPGGSGSSSGNWSKLGGEFRQRGQYSQPGPAEERPVAGRAAAGSSVLLQTRVRQSSERREAA